MKIILAEDDPIMRSGIETFLKSQGHQVDAVGTGNAALQRCRETVPDLILSDVKMPEMDGLSLLAKLQEEGISLPVIIMTAFATVEDAVLAMKNGAEDYLTKPLDLEELKIRIQKIQQKISLLKENRELKKRLRAWEIPEIVGVSKPIREVLKKISSVAKDADVAVMIYGESGTGKELVARSIHALGERSQRPFLAVNCAAIPDDLLESELFGYRKGAFTGAYRDKDGVFQEADGGTLFLDEVSEMSPRMQAKLLRVLQEGQFQVLGSPSQIRVDVRIIGASNRDLKQMIETGNFREDLYYRLNVVEILLPPLRKRPEDIPLLIEHFLNGRRTLIFPEATLEVLQKYPWQGNVRELENLVRMLQATTEGDTVHPEHLPEKIVAGASLSALNWKELWKKKDFQAALHQAIENFEREFLGYHLKKNNLNISQTATAINLSRVSLYKKIKQYDLLSDDSQ